MQDPLYARILRSLISEIGRGEIAPGERLMENRIADRFGVSRAPARQALSELAAKGLAVKAKPPARGFAVALDAAEVARPLTHSDDTPFSSQTVPTWQLLLSEVEKELTRRVAYGSWRLVETALGREYGVSRTVAREVLARLEANGLVINEGRGWVAPELSAKRVRDLYQLRSLLEPAALANVSTTLPAARLDQMIDDLQQAADLPPTASLLDKLEADLHMDLLRQCDNIPLRKAMTEAQSLLLAHQFLYAHTADIYPQEPLIAEHLATLTALRAGQLEQAQTALRDHLLAASDRAIERTERLRGAFQNTPVSYLEQI
ncbi:GntR family transcriptional regulator [Sagittula sp. SSi028]|uniref:GntR family transcriptional regulator n=1 Tax=Sagittula sp. SSi028 TaxID=3400636 RepID=UPI003AF4AD1A